MQFIPQITFTCDVYINVKSKDFPNAWVVFDQKF